MEVTVGERIVGGMRYLRNHLQALKTERHYGATQGLSLLVIGPPGCGKLMTSQAFFPEAHTIHLGRSDLLDFQKVYGRPVVILDEIDCINSNTAEAHRLAVEVVRYLENPNAIVIALASSETILMAIQTRMTPPIFMGE